MNATLSFNAPCALHGSARSGFTPGSRQLAARSPAVVAPQRRCSVVPKALTKKELASVVSDRLPHLTKKETEQAVDTTLAVIVEAVSKGDKVNIAGFGTFEPRDRSARKGRNPQTGEALQIAATRVPAFSAAKGFKDAVKASMNGAPAEPAPAEPAPAQ